MSRRFSAAWTGTLCVAIASFGCESTGVGNPGVIQQLLVTSEDAVEPEADDAAQLDADQLTRAILVVGEFRFVACDGPEEDVVTPGPFVVDLTGHDVTPAIPGVALPPGGICRLDATLALADEPELLRGRSMLFSGVRADGTVFVMVGAVPGTLRLEPTTAGAFDQGEDGWLWALRPRRWLLPAELDAVRTDSGSAVQAVSDAIDSAGVTSLIAINVNRHPLLYAAIRSRLAGRSTLHRDIDGDGELDPDELTGDALIGRGVGDLR